ncbi:hypothetical protein [Georgenia subflava]|nr:hypothetical protein [Georgenia subflava]
MVPQQEAGWTALLDVAERMPHGWSLVGGQLVHLHCVERGESPPRPTTDLDAVLDVRTYPQVLRRFTEVLLDIGFSSAGESPQGHQHRWVREDGAQFDVLIPRHLGEAGASKTGATGGTTIEAPGSQQALSRTETVEVEVAGRAGHVRRPNLIGALVGKSATTEILVDHARERHQIDFATLASLLQIADLRSAELTKLDRRYLGNMIFRVTQDKTDSAVPGATRGINMLRRALDLVG